MLNSHNYAVCFTSCVRHHPFDDTYIELFGLMNKRFQEILSLAQSGQVADALKQCERAIKKQPKEVDYLLLAASLHAPVQDYGKIKDYCLRATRLAPKNTSALYNLSVACLFLKEYENAINYTLPLIKLDSQHAKAHANLGLAYWQTGELEKAKEHALLADKLDPAIATNHNNLGLIYKSLKQTDLAIAHFKRAIELDVQLAEAYYNCAITLLDAGDETGNSYLDKALLIKPDYPEANHYKGLKLLENEQTAHAIDYFKSAITHKSDYAEAYFNLGNAFLTQKEFKFAEAMYRKAIEHKPNYAGAYNNLANTLLDQDDYRHHYAEAEQYFLKAIELAPEMDETYKNLASAYQSQGNYEKALHFFRLYNERVPNDEVVIASMASVHEHRAEFEAGIALLEPFINKDDIKAEIVLAYAKFARHFKFEDKAIHALTGISDDEVIIQLRTEKYYTLGKLSDSKKDVDATFGFYKQANDLEEDKFELAQEQKTFDTIKSYFTKSKIQSLQRSENASTLPIFIVGMPRSGTSLAEQILASHPDVFGAGELDNIHNITKRIGAELAPKNNYPLCLDSMSSDYATQLANEHIATLQAMAPEAKYVVDKMPHNFLGLGVINLLFPNATIIHCKRSSVDTCLSIFFQHFNKHHAYSNNLEMLGIYYNMYADMMEHWEKSLDINIIELEYEKVIANPEEEMRTLLEQCGIGWDLACLKFHENKRTVMTPSYDQVRRPIYTSSVAKWKKYEHHLAELINSLGERAY